MSIPIAPVTGENDIANVKWFVLGASISGNIRLWTAAGATNKYTMNISSEKLTIETDGGEEGR